MIASTTSGGGCRGGWRSRLEYGMVLAHWRWSGSGMAARGERQPTPFRISLQDLRFAQPEVVIFASSNLHTKVGVDNNLPASRRPGSSRPATMGGLASLLSVRKEVSAARR